MNNFTPGISAFQPTTQIQGATDSPLLGMLQQLLQRKIGITSAGTNNYRLDPNSLQSGFIDPQGKYHPGFGSGNGF